MKPGHRAILTASILLSWQATGRANDDGLRARLAAIQTAQAATRERFSKDLQKVEGTEAAQKPAVDRFYKELQVNVDAALELARTHPGDPVAFDALRFVIRTNRAGPGDGTARALRMILEQGFARTVGQGTYLAHVALPLFQYPDAERLLRRVLQENPNREDRAAACYWLAHHLSQQAKMIRRLGKDPEEIKVYERYTAAQPIGEFLKEKDTADLDRAVESLLERAESEFGDVRLEGAQRTLAETVRGELYAIRNLGVGRPAPEIEGRDHDGKRFALSELHGKVVVLSFSGNWCGPCVGMYPQDRELVARYKDRPFALVSVNTDEKVETLKKAIAEGKITWRCWWDGGTEGPITTRWGVESFPSIFVLDRRGLIRFKNLRGVELDRAVASLMDEPDTTAARP